MGAGLGVLRLVWAVWKGGGGFCGWLSADFRQIFLAILRMIRARRVRRARRGPMQCTRYSTAFRSSIWCSNFDIHLTVALSGSVEHTRMWGGGLGAGGGGGLGGMHDALEMVC